MGARMATFMAGWNRVFYGDGRLTMDQGNRNNEPGPPQVQAGSYEWIIPQMFPSADIVNIPDVPAMFRDWGQYAVNAYGDYSGIQGGGDTGDVPQQTNGPTLYFDENTGLYFDLGQGT